MKNLIVSDVSLKEICANQALSLSFREKLEIAKQIGELCLDNIELCHVLDDKADEVLIKTISACSKTTVSIDAGTDEESIDKNYSLIASAKKKRLVITVPVSPVRMEYYVSKKPKAVLELLEALTKKAVSLCNDVEVCLDDATRADKAFLCQTIQSAINSGAKTITLCDNLGAMMPDDFSAFISDVYANVPELKQVKLLIACSDELSMGTANCIAGLSAGADGVKLSAYKGSLPNMEVFFRAIDYIGAKRGFVCTVNRTAMGRIVGRIAQLTAGKGETETKFEEKEITVDIGKNLTQAKLAKITKQRGYDLSNEDLAKVLAEVNRISEKKAVNTKELEVIIASIALQVPPTYELVSFSVQSSNILAATASIVLKRDGVEFSGLSYGNGAVDAAFHALENVTGRKFELDRFEVNAVTEGKEAMGETLVKLRNDGKIYSGRGVSTDIVGASIRAYLNALNKIVYEEAEK